MYLSLYTYIEKTFKDMVVNKKFLLCLSAVVLSIASCSRIDVSVSHAEIDDLFSISISDLVLDNKLSFSEINDFALSLVPQTRNDNKNYELRPILGEKNDTIIYVLEFGNEWKLISSDRRVPPILAEGFGGGFSEIMQDSAAIIWINAMKADMQAVKETATQEIKMSAEEINANQLFWSSFNAKSIYDTSKTTRVTPEIEPFVSGHYELVSSVTTSEVYDSTRLIPTRWHQYEPYNLGCPYNSTLSGHVPAGYVAIAGSQMLYYLHYKDGYPINAPSECNPGGNATYEANELLELMNQSGWNSVIWDSMPLTIVSSNPSAAPLVANVGAGVHTRYSENSSEGRFSELPDVFDANYSIRSELLSYSSDSVMVWLRDGYPVPVCGARNRTGFIWYNYSDYFSFLIDGYVRTRRKTTNTYTWVWDDPNVSGILPYHSDRTTYSYSSPVISYFKMNWGTYSDSNYNARFLPTDGWVYTTSSAELEYQYDRKMILVDKR